MWVPGHEKQETPKRLKQKVAKVTKGNMLGRSTFPFVTFVQLRLHIHQFREEFRG